MNVVTPAAAVAGAARSPHSTTERAPRRWPAAEGRSARAEGPRPLPSYLRRLLSLALVLYNCSGFDCGGLCHVQQIFAAALRGAAERVSHPPVCSFPPTTVAPCRPAQKGNFLGGRACTDASGSALRLREEGAEAPCRRRRRRRRPRGSSEEFKIFGGGLFTKIPAVLAKKK